MKKPKRPKQTQAQADATLELTLTEGCLTMLPLALAQLRQGKPSLINGILHFAARKRTVHHTGHVTLFPGEEHRLVVQ